MMGGEEVLEGVRRMLSCCHCSQIVKQPYLLVCLHVICGECFEQAKKTSTSKPSVTCHRCHILTCSEHFDNLPPPEMLESLLENMDGGGEKEEDNKKESEISEPLLDIYRYKQFVCCMKESMDEYKKEAVQDIGVGIWYLSKREALSEYIKSNVVRLHEIDEELTMAMKKDTTEIDLVLQRVKDIEFLAMFVNFMALVNYKNYMPHLRRATRILLQSEFTTFSWFSDPLNKQIKRDLKGDVDINLKTKEYQRYSWVPDILPLPAPSKGIDGVAGIKGFVVSRCGRCFVKEQDNHLYIYCSKDSNKYIALQIAGLVWPTGLTLLSYDANRFMISDAHESSLHVITLGNDLTIAEHVHKTVGYRPHGLTSMDATVLIADKYGKKIRTVSDSGITMSERHLVNVETTITPHVLYAVPIGLRNDMVAILSYQTQSETTCTLYHVAGDGQVTSLNDRLDIHDPCHVVAEENGCVLVCDAASQTVKCVSPHLKVLGTVIHAADFSLSTPCILNLDKIESVLYVIDSQGVNAFDYLSSVLTKHKEYRIKYKCNPPTSVTANEKEKKKKKSTENCACALS